ncbi:guanylate kinase [Cucumibacter marinus]|uniref:guanylate kinase n=1 Tax=Cucumibacter marinus TaxID=1121252 RepID=UPI0004274FD4|nr:guanylate kinase [Cucumibacter marinus]
MADRRGVMLILSSPSGAGKSSISRAILRQNPDVHLSVSVTTRPRRGDEIDGQHYHFRTVEQFEEMRRRDELLEWARVHDNFYATPKAEVDQFLADGKDVLFDIDYQGALQLYKKRRADVVGVFILPPSIPELKARLERRAEDSQETILKRLRNAAEEIAHWNEYDYVVINRDLEKSVDEVQQILETARLSRPRRTDLESFVNELQAQIESVL